MISLADVQGYITPDPAIDKFKPWWDKALDVLLTGLFMIMIISWTRMYSSESGDVLCVFLSGDTSNLGTQEMRYVYSRCFLESPVTSVQFYPYILLIQWAIMFGCQVAWVYIPTVDSRLRFFSTMIEEILALEPTFEVTMTQGILPEFDYSDVDREKLKLIHEKITFMTMDKNYLSRIYRKKIYLLIFLILVCGATIGLWFSRFTFLQLDFSCDLNNGATKKAYSGVVCNVSTSLFIYWVMVLHAFILLLMLIFAIKGLVWHFHFARQVRLSNGQIFGELDADYKGLPGYIDLALILELFRINTKDGNFKLNTILFVLTAKYERHRSNSDGKAGEKDASRVSFWQELCMVRFMASELGLEISEFSQGPEKFYSYLEKVRSGQVSHSISLCMDIRMEIRDEILNNIEFYSVLLEKSVRYSGTKKDSDLLAPEYLKKIVKGVVSGIQWPDRLILQAATNVLGTTFVLVTVHTPHPKDPLSIDVLEPVKREHASPPILIAFISPCYFYAVQPCLLFDSDQEFKRECYIYKKGYRNKLRQLAIRSVGSAYPKDHHENKGQVVRARVRNIRDQQGSQTNIAMYHGINERYTLTIDLPPNTAPFRTIIIDPTVD